MRGVAADGSTYSGGGVVSGDSGVCADSSASACAYTASARSSLPVMTQIFTIIDVTTAWSRGEMRVCVVEDVSIIASAHMASADLMSALTCGESLSSDFECDLRSASS